MYGDVRREDVRMTWQTREARVPRCRPCRSRHTWLTMLYGLGWMAWAWACASGLLIASDGLVLVGLPLILVGIAMLVVLGKLSSRGVPPGKQRAVGGFPPIRELTAQGWRFGAEPPGVS